MGEALLHALRKSGGFKLAASELHPRPGLVEAHPDVHWAADARALEASSDVLLLCVKPGDLPASVRELRGDKRYISIAAGISAAAVGAAIAGASPAQIARAMPNISATVGASTTAIYSTEPAMAELAGRIFAAAGTVIPLADEKLMHASTALAGSAPAFVFEFVHALAEGGVAEGLSFEAALERARSTVAGAARLLESGEHPAVLRNRVASPAGTTIAGLRALEERNFHGAVIAAIVAAANRSRELSGQ